MDALRVVWLLDELKDSSKINPSRGTARVKTAKSVVELSKNASGNAVKDGKSTSKFKVNGSVPDTLIAPLDQAHERLQEPIFFANDDEDDCSTSVTGFNRGSGILTALLGSEEASQLFKRKHFMGGCNVFDNSGSMKTSSGSHAMAPKLNPVVVRGTSARVQDLLDRYMHNLKVSDLLEDTASDEIQVWLRAVSTPAPLGSVHSETAKPTYISGAIKVSDPVQALRLYEAGNSLYCRAPAVLEQVVVKPLLKELGYGISPDANPLSDRHSRGEIETFFSKAGHVTDTHTDFQENFTVQLSGIKKWTFRRSTFAHPLRGCTPHFGKVQNLDVNETQLKALSVGVPPGLVGVGVFASLPTSDETQTQLLAAEKAIISDTSIAESSKRSRSSSGMHGVEAPKASKIKKTREHSTVSERVERAASSTDSDSNCADMDVVSVYLYPGDVMYHPAGIWHRVECITDSVAINISLYASSAAEVFCASLMQYLWNVPLFRRPLCMLQSTPFGNNVSSHSDGSVGHRHGSDDTSHQHSSSQFVDPINVMKEILTYASQLHPQEVLPLPCFAHVSQPSDEFDRQEEEEEDNDAEDSSDENEETPQEENEIDVLSCDDGDLQSFINDEVRYFVSRTAVVVYPEDLSYMQSGGEQVHGMAYCQNAVNAMATHSSDNIHLNIGQSRNLPQQKYIVHCNFGNENLESISRRVVTFPSFEAGNSGRATARNHTEDESVLERQWLHYINQWIQQHGVCGSDSKSVASDILPKYAFLSELFSQWTQEFKDVQAQEGSNASKADASKAQNARQGINSKKQMKNVEIHPLQNHRLNVKAKMHALLKVTQAFERAGLLYKHKC